MFVTIHRPVPLRHRRAAHSASGGRINWTGWRIGEFDVEYLSKSGTWVGSILQLPNPKLDRVRRVQDTHHLRGWRSSGGARNSNDLGKGFY